MPCPKISVRCRFPLISPCPKPIARWFFTGVRALLGLRIRCPSLKNALGSVPDLAVICVIFGGIQASPMAGNACADWLIALLVGIGKTSGRFDVVGTTFADGMAA